MIWEYKSKTRVNYIYTLPFLSNWSERSQQSFVYTLWDIFSSQIQSGWWFEWIELRAKRLLLCSSLHFSICCSASCRHGKLNTGQRAAKMKRGRKFSFINWSQWNWMNCKLHSLWRKLNRVWNQRSVNIWPELQQSNSTVLSVWVWFEGGQRTSFHGCREQCWTEMCYAYQREAKILRATYITHHILTVDLIAVFVMHPETC